MPSAFFTAGRPRAGLDTAAVHFRSLRSAPARERERSLSFTELLWELTYALENYIRLPRVELPGWDSGETIPDLPTDPQQAARALRARWDLGDGPIPHLVRLLESRGIVVAVLPYLNSDSRKLDGFSTARLPTRPVVVLNDERDDVYRHRYSCAHELGHLLLHGEAHPGDIEHERQANAFAAEFLTPSARLTGSLPTRVDFTALGRLQQTWGVSLDSLLVRSRELGLHTEAVSSRAWRRLKASRAQGLLPFTPVRGFPGEVPVLLQRAFEMAQRKGITVQRLAGDLCWPEDMVVRLLDTQDPRPALHLSEAPQLASATNERPYTDE